MIETDKLKHHLFLLGLILLFLMSPFYHQLNNGGVGLELTLNIPVWAVISWIIAAAILLIISCKQFIYPRQWLYFAVFPIVVIVSSLTAELVQTTVWFFRQLYILGGFVFLIALFQFRANQKTIDQVLFVLVITTGLHALLGTMQVNIPELLSSWFPLNRDFVPRGMFQQVNVNASFLVTGLIVALYLISRPCFRNTTILVKSVVIISFTLSLYVAVESGSRVGLLSMLIAIPLLIWSRFQQLRVHKKLLVVLFIASCCSVLAAQTGLHKTMDKTEKIYAGARVAMYSIGLELVAKEPVTGYGIGSFLRTWNKQAADYVSRHPNTTLPEVVTHPHNELLFWMIEGGLLALAGILAVVVGIFLALYRCGFQRGGAYAAMLLPISLHTQLELPFYLSSVHWFLWLFLIYLLLNHQSRIALVGLSVAATRLIQIVAILLAFGVTIFMVNTARAQADLFKFMHVEDLPPPYLQVALNNFYYRPIAEDVAMRSMLHESIQNNDIKKAEIFESWGKSYVQISPHLKMYEELVLASTFLRPEGKGCDAITAGLAMYPHNKGLKELSTHCD